MKSSTLHYTVCATISISNFGGIPSTPGDLLSFIAFILLATDLVSYVLFTPDIYATCHSCVCLCVCVRSCVRAFLRTCVRA